MASPFANYFGLTGDSVVDGTTTGYFWSLGNDRTIDWSISNGFAGEYWVNPADLQARIGSILDNFSYYANVRFNYVGYYLNPIYASQSGSEINVTLDGGGLFSGPLVWALGFFPDPTTGAIAGDVFLNINSQANYLSSYALGTAGWALFMHELGHALGLKHPHDDGGTGRPILSQIGMGGLDFDWATVMSYQDDFPWNLRQWEPATPMVLDVLALQYIYGKNNATNAGDSTFALSVTNFYDTYWDASGNDTVSAATASEGWLIALPNVRPSRLVDTSIGFAAPIADLRQSSPTTLHWLAGDIENAQGSNFADVITGSDGSNLIAGWGGDDVLDGGGDFDLAIYNGPRANYQTSSSKGEFTVKSRNGYEGTDTLTNIERLYFTDKLIAIDFDGAAAATAKLLGAVLGTAGVHNPQYFGIGLHLFDTGSTFLQVADYALDAILGAARTNDSVVKLLYGHVAGVAPSPTELAYYVSLIDSGKLTQAGLTYFASETALNQSNIDLVGLRGTGVEYVIA